jgi:hypothetical protein
VSLYIVSRELGHGSEEMVRRAYAHLGSVRHRSEVVEYRVEQHFERLDDQLARLRFVINPVISPAPIEANETPTSMDLQVGEEVPEWARRRVTVHGRVNARPRARST